MTTGGWGGTLGRREFLKAGTLVASCAAMLRIGQDAGRPPRVGFMDATTPGATDIVRVTIDGQEVDHVEAFDDVEGWLRRWRYSGGEPTRPEYLEGEVDVYFSGP